MIEANDVELLVDGPANFEAWLGAIRAARTSVFVENYMFGDDEVGRAIRDALVDRARDGVLVALIRDWFGCLAESRDRFWDPLREAGGEVRTFNPLRFREPFGWMSRDHRKVVVVDSSVAFVSGVCASAKWLGEPLRGLAPWRDTGIAIRGPAVRELARSFADTWTELGDPLPEALPVLTITPPPAGDVAVRIVAARPTEAEIYRLDQLVATLASKTLWISDAYFVGTASYVQALAAAARDGVDVRLLLPGRSDVPIVGQISRAGYHVLLESGVRIYEWNGTMLHAKTAVVDERYARVGSTNLNLASWLGNREIDVVVENEAFARRMHAQYEEDLRGATEIVLDGRAAHPSGPRTGGHGRPAHGRRARGSSRAAAGALRVANAAGAAVTDRRELAPAEGGVLAMGAALLAGTAAVAFVWPRALAWPIAGLASWASLALAAKYVSVEREPRVRRSPEPPRPRRTSPRSPSGTSGSRPSASPSSSA